jgi:hypothetical protein
MSPPRPSSIGFDWTFTALSAFFVGGLFLDGWAHTHGRVDETFFTLWHAVLYSGFLVSAVFLWAAFVWGVRRGYGWRAALPDGYGLALLGVPLWLFGGPFDAAWHEVFGFEADVEALMSPAHLVLAVGLGLMVSGPLRAGLRRSPRGWSGEVPLVLSLTFLVSLLTFFTQIAHPLANLWAAGTRTSSDTATELGLVGFCLTTAIVLAPVLLLARHGRWPVGGLTVLVGVNSAAMGVLYDEGDYPLMHVVVSVAAGLASDILLVLLRPRGDRPGAFRGFACLAPVVLTGAYFAGLAFTTGIGWSSHLWLGTVAFAGLVGWLASYLMLPPRVAAA